MVSFVVVGVLYGGLLPLSGVLDVAYLNSTLLSLRVLVAPFGVVGVCLCVGWLIVGASGGCAWEPSVNMVQQLGCAGGFCWSVVFAFSWILVVSWLLSPCFVFVDLLLFYSQGTFGGSSFVWCSSC